MVTVDPDEFIREIFSGIKLDVKIYCYIIVRCVLC
jgi:hypothetical protein